MPTIQEGQEHRALKKVKTEALRIAEAKKKHANCQSLHVQQERLCVSPELAHCPFLLSAEVQDVWAIHIVTRSRHFPSGLDSPGFQFSHCDPLHSTANQK